LDIELHVCFGDIWDSEGEVDEVFSRIRSAGALGPKNFGSDGGFRHLYAEQRVTFAGKV